MTTDNKLRSSALRTIDIESQSILELKTRIDSAFEGACELIMASPGRVAVLGIGKSGHVGRKIAATLASTGTPAVFVHPAEAGHGDLGMITEQDVVVAISNSGTTEEIMTLLPVLKRKGIPLIALTGATESLLAHECRYVLDVGVKEEACPLGLAPTSSTTAALVMGDALAMALLEARGFTEEDFAISHPGGRLGRKLLVKVEDIMHSGDSIPRVTAHTSLADALVEMSRKGFGMTTVVEAEEIIGVFTDGDLRRCLDAGKDLHTTKVADVMSANFKHITASALAAEAANIMQKSQVYVLIVTDSGHRLSGILKMHDLLQANVV
ncbi:MAG: KpsF/GutQ family sugar-phosphate isomerase [Pseudohongiellaceae bacterium]|jgi:arabinose-5-phosphate isomerase|nr:KpsF/GutQ family sugar-phosphate isomerase [Gammaproteobacteria bacterium]